MWGDIAPWAAIVVPVVLATIGLIYRAGRRRGERKRDRESLERRIKKLEDGQDEIRDRLRHVVDEYLQDGGAVRIGPSEGSKRERERRHDGRR